MTLQENLRKIRDIAYKLKLKIQTQDDLDYLADLMGRISEGENPIDVFGIKPPKGVTLKSVIQKEKMIQAFRAISAHLDEKTVVMKDGDWIVINDNGSIETVDAIITKVADQFGYDFDTLKRYWYDKDNKRLQTPYL
jgi:hypothetical protein